MEKECLDKNKKKAKRTKAWVVFADETGISQTPCVRYTWAPIGKTPIIKHTLKWKKLSVCGAIGYKWDGSDNRLYFSIQENNYNSESLIKFLKSLRRHRNGRKTILVWDSLPAHRSNKMRAFIKTQKWLSVEHLPAYSPDLNPTENVWSNLKGQELANRCENNLNNLKKISRRGLRRICSRKTMLNNFLNHAGLFFD